MLTDKENEHPIDPFTPGKDGTQFFTPRRARGPQGALQVSSRTPVVARPVWGMSPGPVPATAVSPPPVLSSCCSRCLQLETALGESHQTEATLRDGMTRLATRAHELYVDLINSQEDVKAYQAEYHRIQEEGKRLHVVYRAKCNRAKDLSHRLADAQMEEKTMKERLSKQAAEINEWKEQCKSQAKLFKYNVTELTGLRERGTQLREERDRIRGANARLEEDLDRSREEAEGIRNELRRLQEEIVERERMWNTEKGDLEKRTMISEQKVVTTQTELEEKTRALENERGRLEQEIEDLETLLERRQESVMQELTHYQEQLNTLPELQNMVVTLRREQQESEDLAKELEASRQSLAARRESWGQKENTFRARIDELENELTTRAASLDTFEETVTRLRRDLESSRADRTSMEAELRDTRKSLEHQVEELRRTAEDHRFALEQHAQGRQEAASEALLLRKQLDEKEMVLNTSLRDFRARTEELDHVLEELSLHKHMFYTLQTHLADARQEVEEAENRAAQAEADAETLEKAVLDTDEGLVALGRLDQLQMEVAGLLSRADESATAWTEQNQENERVFLELVELQAELDKPISDSLQHTVMQVLKSLEVAASPVVQEEGIKQSERVLRQADTLHWERETRKLRALQEDFEGKLSEYKGENTELRHTIAQLELRLHEFEEKQAAEQILSFTTPSRPGPLSVERPSTCGSSLCGSSRLSGSEATPNTLRMRFESATISNELLREEVASFQEELRRKEEDLHVREDSLETMNATLAEREGELLNVYTRLEQLEMQTEHAQAAALQESNEERIHLKTYTKELEDRCDQMSRTIQSLEESVVSTQEANLATQRVFDSLSDEKGNLEGVIHDLLERIHAFEIAQEESDQNDRLLLHEADEMREVMQAALLREEKAKEKLSEQITMTKNLQNDLRLVYKKHKKDLADIEHQYKHDDYKTRYEEAVREVQRLSEQVQAVEHVASDLEELEQLQIAVDHSIERNAAIILKRGEELFEDQKEWKTKVAHLQAEKEEMKSQLTELSDKLMQAQSGGALEAQRIRDLEEREEILVKELEESNQKLTEGREVMNQVLEALQRESAKSCGTAAALVAKDRELAWRMRDLQETENGRLEDAQTDVKRAQDAVQEKEQEMVELRQHYEEQLTFADNERSVQNAQVEELEKQVEELKDLLADSSSFTHTLQEQLTILQGRAKELEEELAAAQERTSGDAKHMQEMIAVEMSKAASVDAALREERTARAVTEEHLNRVTEELTSTQQLLEHQSSLVQSLQKEAETMQELREEIETVKQQASRRECDLQSQVEDFTTEVKDLRMAAEEVTRLQDHLNEEQHRVADLTHQMQETMEILHSTDVALQSARSEVVEMRRSLDEIPHLKRMLRDAQSSVDDLKFQGNQTRFTVSQMQGELQRAHLKIRLVENEKESLLQQIEFITSTRGTTDNEDQARSRMSLEQELSQMRIKYEAAVQDATRISSEIDHMRQYVGQYKEMADQKIRILQNNLYNADKEVEELDSLLRTVHEELLRHGEAIEEYPDLARLIEMTSPDAGGTETDDECPRV